MVWLCLIYLWFLPLSSHGAWLVLTEKGCIRYVGQLNQQGGPLVSQVQEAEETCYTYVAVIWGPRHCSQK